MECRNCGWKVFEPVLKTRFCPSCGVRFTSEIRVPVGWPSLVFLVCPGIVTLFVSSRSDISFRAVACGVVTALIFSVPFGFRGDSRTERIWAFFITFMASLMVGILVVFFVSLFWALGNWGGFFG